MIEGQFKRPYFTLELKVQFCRFRAEVNGVPLLEGEPGVDAEVGLNQWIFSGENSLGLKLLPVDADNDNKLKEDVSFVASVYVREINADISSRKLILQQRYSRSSGGLKDVDPQGFLGEKGAVVEDVQSRFITNKVFNIRVKFPSWSWRDGENITVDYKVIDELYKEYDSYADIFNSRNSISLDRLMTANAEENMGAYYLGSISESLDDLEVRGLMHQSDVRLNVNRSSTNVVDVVAKGKLVRIVDSEGESILNYSMPGINGYVEVFYYKKGTKWIQIR